jgi:hypothetical protein
MLLSPTQRLKKQIETIIRHTGPGWDEWSEDDKLSFLKGVGDGYLGGMKGTLDFIKSLPSTAKGIFVGAKDLLYTDATFFTDLAFSWLYGIEPVEALRLSHQADVFRERYTPIIVGLAQFSSILAVVVGPDVLVQNWGIPAEWIPNSVRDMQVAVANEIIDTAGPIATALIEKAGNLTPEQKGYIVGIVIEQVLEAVATAGAGALVKGVALPRLAALLEKIPGAEKLGETLNALKQAANAIKIGDKTVGELIGKLAALLTKLDHCFAAGTPILTPSGEKFIEDFEVGDEILTRPEDSPDAPLRTSTVEKVFHLSGLTVEMSVGGRTVTTTEQHPFYVVGKGWTWAGELQPGDEILGHDGTATAVESVAPTGRHETLYNLRVAFDRTYFVGGRDWGFSLWAHNFYAAFFEDGVWKIGSFSRSGKLEKVLDSGEIAKVLAASGEKSLTADEARKIAALASAGVDYKGFEFGAHLRRLIGEPPPGMFDAHAHHILFKDGLGDAQKALVREGQEILRSVGIDPIFGRENLVWAPRNVSEQHAITSLEPLVTQLRALKARNAPYEEYVKLLKAFGRIAAARS